MSSAAGGTLLIGQFNLTETCSEGFPPYKQNQRSTDGTPTLSFKFFSPASAIFLRCALFLAPLIVGCHGNKSTGQRVGGGDSIIEAVVGLVVSWELGIVK